MSHPPGHQVRGELWSERGRPLFWTHFGYSSPGISRPFRWRRARVLGGRSGKKYFPELKRINSKSTNNGDPELVELFNDNPDISKGF